MGRLGDHPHIVTIHDVGDEAGQPFIVSQYMAGGDLEDVLRDQEAHRLPLGRALALAHQVSLGLAHAHAQGVIHRDIKPGNIWLTHDGTAKLGDFGLAVALDRSRLTMAGSMVGTAAYMPPEQALGGQADARSDLYSLGCVLYEMLTGRPPFLGDDTLSIISQHINTAPIATTWHNPAVPSELDELVMCLLAKVPEDRPAAAAEVVPVLAALAAAPAPDTAREAPLASAAAQVRGFRRGPFVGREKELAQLKERFEDALSEHGLLVMLVGEPGIGKTRMAEELSVYARLRGAQALTGQCYETEGAPPYIPFVEALRQYVNSRPAEDLRLEMGDGASDLAKLVSEVRTRLPEVPSGPQQEPESERYRLLEAVTSFLINASKSNPLLLILDDLHWADKPTLLLLEHLARRLSGARIMVVGTYRDVELDRRHPLSEVIADLRRERLYERILVRGLDPDGVRAMLAGRGAMSGRPEQYVNPALSKTLYEQTEGNPFFIEEIILHLVDVGALYRKEGQWQMIRMSALAEHILEGVREVIGRRLSRLSAAANEALSFASVIGREFDFDVLHALSEMQDEPLLAALEEALGAQLINEQKTAAGTAYRFSHALVQETLYGELSIARKQRVHLRAGRALEGARAGRLEAHVGQLAYHFHQGNDAAKAMEYSRQAGDAAIRVYAWEEAVRHWGVALELMEEHRLAGDEERAQLLERLGDITYVSGIDLDKGTAFLERALAIYQQMGARGKVAATHSRLGRGLVTYFGRMDMEKGPAHLEAARAILEEDAPESAGLAYVYSGLCTTCLLRGEMEKGMVYSRRALEIGEKLNSRPVTAMAQVFTGNFLAHLGKLREGLGLLERGWAIADEDGLTFVAFLGALFSGSHHAFYRSDPGEARRWLQRELARPRVASAPILRRMLCGFLAQAHTLAGEMDEARQMREDVLDDSFAISSLLIASGEWEAAEELMLAGLEKAGAGVPWNVQGISRQLGQLCFRRGEHDRAEEYLRSSFRVSTALRSLDSRLTLVRLLARMGRLKEAQEELDKCVEFLSGDEDWGGTAGQVALARGAVRSSEGKWNEAEASFEEALAVARKCGLPWDEADALHERARMHLARDEKDDRRVALGLFDETIAIFQRLGAKKHLEVVLADKLAAQGIESSDVKTSIDRVAASVQSHHPNLKPHAAPDGTVTIMFSDIEGSTVLTERLGDKAWMEVLREHNTIVRKQVKAHGGFEVKSEGDGFMVAFQSAGKTLACASAIQKALVARNETATEPVLVRMGLHAGEVIKEGEDFFGRNVIMAARVASQARGGEILTSAVVKTLMQGSDMTWGEKRTVSLKGLSGEHEIWDVNWS